jgi:hypothetical protein
VEPNNGTAPEPEGARKAPALRNSNAERQARFRERNNVLRRDLAALLEEFRRALEATEGKSAARLALRLPEDPAEWVPELTERLRSVKLIVARRHKPEKETPCPERD